MDTCPVFVDDGQGRDHNMALATEGFALQDCEDRMVGFGCNDPANV